MGAHAQPLRWPTTLPRSHAHVHVLVCLRVPPRACVRAENFAFTSDSPVAAAGDTTGTASGAAHGVALGADVTAARPPAMRPSTRAAQPSASSERRTLFVTRQSARALAHQVAAVRRGAEGGVDMRDIPMQQVELQPCDPATQDCKELEWVFRIEKPDFSTPAAPRRVLEEEEEAGSDAGQREPASDGSGAGSSGDGDGAGGAGMVESVMSWLGGSGGADDAKPQEPAASPDARPPLVPPVADDEFGAHAAPTASPPLAPHSPHSPPFASPHRHGLVAQALSWASRCLCGLGCHTTRSS